MLGKPLDTIQEIAGLHIEVEADGVQDVLQAIVLLLHHPIAFNNGVEGLPDPALLFLYRLFRLLGLQLRI